MTLEYLHFLKNLSAEKAYHGLSETPAGVEGEHGSQVFRD